MKKASAPSILVAMMLLAVGVTAQAQQPKKVPRIGFLIGSSPAAIAARIEAFRQGLRELGDVEGKNIVIEWRYAELKFDRLPDLADEVVRFKVDIIVNGASTLTSDAKPVTTRIPIATAGSAHHVREVSL